MKHLGDITSIDWSQVEPVDCVTGGSPCQDLSIAGKRAGLTGERSGLYMEQIRCIKELRRADIEYRGRTDATARPRWMVWENVPGAFSSNQGKDFAAVLEEAVRVVQPEEPPVPVPDKGWPRAGLLYDDMGRWSIAWRVHDAQFWGVPQRRQRISLVCDFGGLAAGEVLFDRKGLHRHPAESGEEGKGAASHAEGGTAPASWTLKIRGGCEGGGKGPLIQTEKVGTLSTLQDQTLFQAIPTLSTADRHGVACVTDVGFFNSIKEQSPTHLSRMYKDPPLVSFEGCECVVRRLTPMELERLQGFPDGWTDIGEWVDSRGKKHRPADSPRYKALGNSIALPFWFYLLRRISATYERPATLGSLFDGIGGFPLCWERCNGKGTARWASEIEEFPIAVTKLRFPEEDAP